MSIALIRFLGFSMLRALLLAAWVMGGCIAGVGAAQAPLLPSSPWLHIEGLPGVQAQVAIAQDPEEDTPLPTLIDQDRFVPQAGLPRTPQHLRYVWFRIDLTVPAALQGRTAALRVVPTLIYKTELHQPALQVQRSGMSLPVAQQANGHMPALFDVLLQGDTLRLYLRVGSSVQPMTHISLLSQAALADTQRLYTLSQGLYYGATSLMLVLALLSWALSRESLQRDFAVYIACSMAFSLFLNGYVMNYLIPDSPDTIARLSMMVSAALVASTIWFVSKLMALQTHWPRAERWVRLSVPLALLCGVCGFHIPWIGPLAPVLWGGYFAVNLLLLVLSFVQARRLNNPREWLLFGGLLLFTILEKPTFFSGMVGLPVDAWMPELGKAGLVGQMLSVQVLIMLRVREQRATEAGAYAAQQEADSQRRQRQDMAHFLGVFGHEVRTPLAVIDAVAQSLQILPGAEVPEVKKRHLSIRKAVTHMSQLAHRALAEERIESENYTLRCQAVDVLDVMNETLTLHGVDVSSQGWLGDTTLPMSVGEVEGGAIDISVHGALPTLWADPGMLNVALGNLIDNARKYATPGSTIKLVAEATPPGTALPGIALHVVNEGAHLSEGELAQVFDKYWRKEGDRTARGVGFGLHMVQKIMLVHGGQAVARALPGGAVCFSLQIPAGGPEAAPQP